MKVNIHDNEVLLSLRPMSLIGYLRAKGWRQYSTVSGKNAVWIHTDPEAEVVIPFRREAVDFLVHMRNLLSELEIVEERSQLDIIRDLLNSGFDVIRFAARSTNTSDGTICINDGVKLFNEAKNILLAAACSAVNPRSVFHARKPQQANDYIENARLGQTEHGSYVLTLLSPVAPQLQPYSETNLFPEDPFERRVVKTLSSGIQSAISAAESSILSIDNTFSPFADAVQLGVSANLCESLVGFFEIQNSHEIEVSFGWAQNRPLPTNVHSRILISNDIIPTITEAARIFRQTDTLLDYPLRGPVIKLERQDGHSDGHVTIMTIVEDMMRKVTLQLPEDEYELATKAHQNYQSVQVRGNLSKVGRLYQLKSPTSFSIATEDD